MPTPPENIAPPSAADLVGARNPLSPEPGQKPAKPKTKPKDGGITLKPPGDPPTTAKGPPGTPTALKLMSEKYPNFKDYLPKIKAAANLYKIDAVELYGVLVALGSRGDPAYTDKSGATGLARIYWSRVEKAMNPSQYDSFVKKWGNQALERAGQPDFAINFLAWAMAGSRSNYATLDAWLGQGPEGASNKGARYGKSPYQIVKPPGTTPTDIIERAAPDYQPSGAPSIPDTTDRTIDKSKDKATLLDPYIGGVTGEKPGGQLVLTGDINKAMRWMGVPLRRSDFLQIAASRAKYFEDYTGKSPTMLQIGNLIRNNWGERDLITLLAKGPNFKRSPIYQRDSLAYQDAGKDLVPRGTKIPDDLMRKAIVNGWTIGSFQQALRNQGYYERSNEFQNNFGVLQSSYRNIMGEPTAEGNKIVKRATKLQWTQPIFESWLRKQDTYKYSPEYQAKAVGFLDAMGMFIGARATLSELSVAQMAKVPTAVTEGGKEMQMTPPLDLMPSGQNPMLKATFPYTSTPTPPTHAGVVVNQPKVVPIASKKQQAATKTKPPLVSKAKPKTAKKKSLY